MKLKTDYSIKYPRRILLLKKYVKFLIKGIINTKLIKLHTKFLEVITNCENSI